MEKRLLVVVAGLIFSSVSFAGQVSGGGLHLEGTGLGGGALTTVGSTTGGGFPSVSGTVVGGGGGFTSEDGSLGESGGTPAVAGGSLGGGFPGASLISEDGSVGGGGGTPALEGGGIGGGGLGLQGWGTSGGTPPSALMGGISGGGGTPALMGTIVGGDGGLRDAPADLPNLPALNLEDLPVVDFSQEKPFLRNLTEEEQVRSRAVINERRFSSDLIERDLAYGDCHNDSGYWAGIYGPNVSGRPYDNDLYMVPPGYKSPEGWDCDGFFIPSDVTLYMTPSEIHSGPGAAKIVNIQWGVLESLSRLERKVDANFLIWLAPGSVKWNMPGFPQQDLDDLGDTWRPKPPAGQ